MTERTSALIPLRWSDMDAYGHVNNVQYLRLLEDARIAGFEDWFGPHGSESLLEGGVIVARTEVEYLRPLVYRRAPVQIDMWVSRLGGASFDVGYELRDPAEMGDAVYMRAETTMSAYDFAGERPRRLRDSEREVLRSRLAEPVALRRRR
ncbi:thioesterase family protein [Marihabitans asiaticum]|uniref:Acyl-CoA thioester hydrolase n=1 Tax=Marihabitans asiaticum TaxID=415218 RepID=A0A560W7Y9_9MICO|nr:thioesterase family protein [Marihabitans asiaticum]TWD13744.1 acyl-CoA thioester hydrolase [Marihabitans asiaticum]